MECIDVIQKWHTLFMDTSFGLQFFFKTFK